MLEKAREKAKTMGNIVMMKIAAQSMDFTGRFDLAFSNSALQWVKEQQEVIKLAYKSLKQGGRIAFQLPAKDFCREFFEYTSNAIASLNLKEIYSKWKSPWYFPTKEEYETLLNNAGFGNINVSYKDYRLVFVNVNEVLDSWVSTGLRPYLSVLPDKKQEYFKYAFAMNFENNRTTRGIEFVFRRLFAFAEK